MNPANPNVAASVRARLLNVAKAQGVDFNQVLVRFSPPSGGDAAAGDEYTREVVRRVQADGTCWLYSEQTVFGEGVRPHVECIFSEVTDLQRQRQELLRECGFRYFTTFTGGKPEFKEL